MRRIAPNSSFAIAFGLAGLGGVWLAAADARWAPRAVDDSTPGPAPQAEDPGPSS